MTMRQGRGSAAVLVILTLLTFAAGVFLVTLPLRARIRAEILERDGLILQAVAQREAAAQGEPILGPVLRAVELEGVLGVRVFEADGRFVRALPDHLIAGALAPGLTREPRIVSRFSRSVLLCTIYTDPFGDLGGDAIPMVNVFIPIRGADGKGVRGYAEFLLDGRPTAEAFRRLDRDLLRQSLGVFLGGGGLIVAILLLSLRQIVRRNRELAAANRELALHARTAAIGAVSSHLFHGLKNAVSGLHLAIDQVGDAARPDARASAQRIERMVQDAIDVIRDEEHGIAYELTAREILDLARTRTQSLAARREVAVDLRAARDAAFSNRDANLILLVLENLLTNAIEASPPGQAVECRFEAGEGVRRFLVTDHGAGIPENRRDRLFDPGDSTKADGSGIGLSISRQVCRHFGGQLRLVRTGADGTSFELSVIGAGAGEKDCRP